MRVIRSQAQPNLIPGAAVVSVGNFDGLHAGHRAVLRSVVEDARRRRAEAVALTFDPHPLRVLRPESAPPLITPLEHKIELFASTGIDVLLIMAFTPALSRLSPREFVEQVLVRGVHASAVHEGPTFQFGYRHEGNMETLRALGTEFHFDVVSHPEQIIRGLPVSSTRIRELIRAGEVDRAARLLGRPFSVTGPIVQGHAIGRRLTVPTLNLAPYGELLPANGVYVTRTRVGEHWFDSVTNAGTRPTFQGSGITVESHLLDFQPVDAGEEAGMEVCFCWRLREERAFENPEQLRTQILKDVGRSRHYFSLLKKLAAPGNQ